MPSQIGLIELIFSTIKRTKINAISILALQRLINSGFNVVSDPSFKIFVIRFMIWCPEKYPSETNKGECQNYTNSIHYFPWKDILHALLWGAGDCAEVTWKWLGLSMAAWSALYFFVVLLVSGFIVFRLGTSFWCVKKKSK